MRCMSANEKTRAEQNTPRTIALDFDSEQGRERDETAERNNVER